MAAGIRRERRWKAGPGCRQPVGSCARSGEAAAAPHRAPAQILALPRLARQRRSATPGPAVVAGGAQLGSARLSTARLSLTRLDSVQPGSAQPGSRSLSNPHPLSSQRRDAARCPRPAQTSSTRPTASLRPPPPDPPGAAPGHPPAPPAPRAGRHPRLIC